MPTNPMVKNLYGQNGQMQQGGMPPQGGGMSPEEMQVMQQSMQQPQQETYNPFDVGISRAVQSSRAALRMAPDQEGRALRKAMMSFGESVGGQPKVRGFMGNLGQGLRALGAGVSAHDDAEVAAYAENQAQAEKLLAYQMAKQQQDEAQKQRVMDNEFREKQFGETQRAHNLIHSAAMGRGRGGIDNEGIDKREERKTSAFEEKENIKSNNKYVDKVKPTVDEAETKNRVMDKLATILKAESSAGGTPADALNRYLKKVSGNDSNLTQAAMLKKYFFKDIKGVAGNPNIKEWNDLVNTMITVDKNVDGTLAMIDYEKGENQKKIKQFDSLRKALSKTGRRLHYDSQEIRDMIDQDLGLNNSEGQTSSNTTASPTSDKRYFMTPEGNKIGIPISNEAKIQRAIAQQLQEVGQ